jgi:hypothetical protein
MSENNTHHPSQTKLVLGQSQVATKSPELQLTIHAGTTKLIFHVGIYDGALFTLWLLL